MDSIPDPHISCPSAGLTRHRPPSLRLAALVVMTLASATLRAQPVAMPVADVQPISLEAGLDVEHHTNLFRVAGGPSGTVLRGLAGLRLDRTFSLQRIALAASVQPVLYPDQSGYDYLGYLVGASWDWQLGRPVFGQLEARLSRDQTAFDVIGQARNNLQDLRMARGLAGARLTQAWSVIGALDVWQSTNSLPSQAPADYTRQGVEAGLRYAAGGATGLDMVWRHESAHYPNRQVLDSGGNPLPGAIDNAYAQDTPLARLTYRPDELTRLAGQLGYTRRRYDNIPQRDFSGVTTAIDADWPLSGQLLLQGRIYRSIDVAELTSANYIDARGLVLRPLWQLTGRSRLEASVGYANRRYLGDPGVIISGAPVRSDHLREAGLRLRYELTRRVAAHLEYRQLSRSSNYPDNDFTDRWVGVGLRVAL